MMVYMRSAFNSYTREVEIPYSEFKGYLRQNRITSVVIRPDLITGQFRDSNSRLMNFRTFPLNDPDLVKELEQYGVSSFSGKPEKNWWLNALMNYGFTILFILFWIWMFRSAQGGGKQIMGFGRSRARLQTGQKVRVTFADVAGCDESKEELKEIIEFLKDPEKFQRLGGKIPKGVLVYGAPGTGKTLLAKAVAGEAGVPFFSSSGSEFVEMFVGVGASRVRDLFEQGRRNAPCLLFIDEIDAVGRHRFAGIGGGHDEREQTLNQLLVEMDGFDTREGVILIAATNRPDVLDPALLRPGRFDRHIAVPTPDLKGREEILKVHCRHVKLSPLVDLKIIAQRTPGFVGADLANLVNEAALLAARRNKEFVEMPEMEEAIERVIAGPARKSRMISAAEKKMIAFHEAGHTLVAKKIPGSDPIHKVSIIPRGPALGYTLQLPSEDRYLTTKKELISKLTVLLGGRVAEEMIFGEITTGAQNDLTKATQIARKMVIEFGMSETLGPISLKSPDEEIFIGRDFARQPGYSEKTAQMIDEEVKNLIQRAQEEARNILINNRPVLEKLAAALIEKEILDTSEIEAIVTSA